MAGAPVSACPDDGCRAVGSADDDSTTADDRDNLHDIAGPKFGFGVPPPGAYLPIQLHRQRTAQGQLGEQLLDRGAFGYLSGGAVDPDFHRS